MNPLLVCLSYPPKQVSQRGVDNLSNLINHGFDCVTIQPAPIVWKELMRKSFFKYTNWHDQQNYHYLVVFQEWLSPTRSL